MREKVLGETGRVLGETGMVLGVGPYLVIKDHVHLEGWKHDNRDTGARAKHGALNRINQTGLNIVMSKESPNTLVLTKMYINEKLKLKESKSNNTHKIKKMVCTR